MKYPIKKFAPCLIVLIISIFIVTACSETVVLSDLPGTYSGKDIVLVRYDKDGQYLYKDDMIQVSIIIGNNGEVSGMVGEAALAECKVTPNRGWLSRQLNIKTDFIINGKLNGRTFEKDSILNKNISIPFNVNNGELTGSLFLNNKGNNYPAVRTLKLKKL